MTKMNIKIEACLTAISQKEYHQIQAEVSKIQELLEKGCNVDGQNKDGDTLLHATLNNFSLRGHNAVETSEKRFENVMDTFYLISKYHPNPLITNNQGLTPAMLAARLKHTAEWQLLSSYETAYVAKQTARMIQSMHIIAELSGSVGKKAPVLIRARNDMLNCAHKLGCEQKRIKN